MGVNHMKKLISTLLAACVLLSLAACGAAPAAPQAARECSTQAASSVEISFFM